VQLALAGDEQRAVGGVPHSRVARVRRRSQALLRCRARLGGVRSASTRRVGCSRLRVGSLGSRLACEAGDTCLKTWEIAEREVGESRSTGAQRGATLMRAQAARCARWRQTDTPAVRSW
jgi:hypothetical protein